MASNFIVFSTFTLIALFFSPLPTLTTSTNLIQDDAIVKPLQSGWPFDFFDIMGYELKNGLNAASQCYSEVTITNKGVGTLKLMGRKSWHGDFPNPSPSQILKDKSVKFEHQGTPNPSEAAIIYAGPNAPGQPDNCAWVVAWFNDGTTNKVYVETGPSKNYNPLPWDKILDSLKKSGPNSHFHSTGCGTTAEGTTSNGLKAVVGTIFKVGS